MYRPLQVIENDKSKKLQVGNYEILKKQKHDHDIDHNSLK